MAHEGKNIVQAEFFLVNTDPRTTTLERVEHEARVRTRDRMHVKEGVRFYDTDGSLTKLIQTAKDAHERAHEQTMNFPLQGGRLSKFFAEWLIRTNDRIHEGKKEQARKLAIQKLQTIARTTKEIAVERGAHEFTMAKPNELHELIEAIKKSNGVWFFLFKPNVLTADKNESIGYTM